MYTRFRPSDRLVLDHAGNTPARVCECVSSEYATRIAQALNLMGHLEEVYTTDHDEMLRLALAALGEAKKSPSAE